MKRERALGIGLKLLGLAFAISPLLIAFSMNNWDVQATLFNTQGFEDIENKIGGLFGESEGGGIQINRENIEYDNQTKEARIPIVISLPISFPIDLTGFSLTGTVGGEPVSLAMEKDRVPLPPQENTTVYLTGKMNVDPTTADIQIARGTITLEKYGVTIQMSIQEGNL